MRFQVPKGWFVVAIVIPMALWSAWLAWVKFSIANPLSLFIGTVGLAIVLAWLGALTQVIDISADGLVLYRVNRVPWADVVGARRTRVLRLAYLKLRLRSGRTWWLPLFFRGRVDMQAALLELAPPGHPVRSCFAGE